MGVGCWVVGGWFGVREAILEACEVIVIYHGMRKGSQAFIWKCPPVASWNAV